MTDDMAVMDASAVSDPAAPPAAAPMEAAGLPWVDDAGKVAPKDARALPNVFFDRLRDTDQ